MSSINIAFSEHAKSHPWKRGTANSIVVCPSITLMPDSDADDWLHEIAYYGGLSICESIPEALIEYVCDLHNRDLERRETKLLPHPDAEESEVEK